MSIRRLAPIVAVVAFGLFAAGVGTASATSLRFDPGNVAAPASTIRITNTTSDTAVLTTGLGKIDCRDTKFTADVLNSPATVLSGRLTQLTFTTCTDTIAPINVTSCHLHTPPIPVIQIHANVGGSAQTVIDPVVRCAIQNSTSGCYFTAATAQGVGVNANASLNFPAVSAATVAPTTDALGVGLCGLDGTFSVTLTHIVEEGSNRTVTVAQ
jgi:hypothetical protein